MIERTPEAVEAVGKALHTFHGRGYCSEGQHLALMNYHCWDEARVVIDALNGHTPREYPRETTTPATLAARKAGQMEQENRRRSHRRQAVAREAEASVALDKDPVTGRDVTQS